MLGRRYVIDYCVSELKRLQQEESYRYYVTDALMYVVNNVSGQDSKVILNTSYRELMNPVTEQVKESNDKKAENIINHIKNKLKGG